ncbi:MAG: GNAT family N-acetyltransferase [Tepidisphaeraceae bacterium]|jgi:GNAT superfamily N-acetyltransferase
MGAQTDLEILPAVPADVPAILGFIRRLAEYEKLSHEMQATEQLLNEHLFGARPSAEAIIARLDRQPAGFALFFGTFSTFLGKPGIWLEDLFVLPEHRRKGIGLALLQRVAGIAVQRGCGRLEWSVLDWNEPALNFYKQLGAVPMGDWTTQRVVGAPLLKLAGNA